MLNDFLGLAFIVLVIAGLYAFLRYKISKVKNVKPDLLEAALLHKEIAEGNHVLKVPEIVVIGQ